MMLHMERSEQQVYKDLGLTGSPPSVQYPFLIIAVLSGYFNTLLSAVHGLGSNMLACAFPLSRLEGTK